MIWSFAIIGTFAVALFAVDKLLSAPKYKENTSDHFDGKRFINPNDTVTHNYGDVLKWWLSGNDKGVWHNLTEQKSTPQFISPQERNRGDCHITFVNHATFLLQLDGQNILTDPIWSHRASPYQWIGPKRMSNPGIPFDDLPTIDTVLISHNHYDHLDTRTVKKLKEEHNPQFIVPLGVEKYLHEKGISNTVRLDWWEKVELDGQLDLTAVPAQHFSGRGLFDRNKTLWCGYVLHTSLGNIYFAGDTGYGNFVKDIGNKFGPMYTSIIPIGAYKPRWFMKSIHMSPEEAVKAHQDVQSQYSIGMHFGTFPMADDGMYEPAEDLAKARDKYQLTEKEFFILEQGESHKANAVTSATGTGIA